MEASPIRGFSAKTSSAKVDTTVSILETTDLTTKGGSSLLTFTGAETGVIEWMASRTLTMMPPEVGGLVDEALASLFQANDSSNILTNVGFILPPRLIAKVQRKWWSLLSQPSPNALAR